MVYFVYLGWLASIKFECMKKKKQLRLESLFSFSQYKVAQTDLGTHTLWLSVWDWDKFGRNHFLGEVRLSLGTIDLTDSTDRQYDLREMVCQSSNTLTWLCLIPKPSFSYNLVWEWVYGWPQTFSSCPSYSSLSLAIRRVRRRPDTIHTWHFLYCKQQKLYRGGEWGTRLHLMSMQSTRQGLPSQTQNDVIKVSTSGCQHEDSNQIPCISLKLREIWVPDLVSVPVKYVIVWRMWSWSCSQSPSWLGNETIAWNGVPSTTSQCKIFYPKWGVPITRSQDFFFCFFLFWSKVEDLHWPHTCLYNHDIIITLWHHHLTTSSSSCFVLCYSKMQWMRLTSNPVACFYWVWSSTLPLQARAQGEKALPAFRRLVPCMFSSSKLRNYPVWDQMVRQTASSRATFCRTRAMEAKRRRRLSRKAWTQNGRRRSRTSSSVSLSCVQNEH